MASVIVERSSVLPALLPGSSHTTIGNAAWINGILKQLRIFKPN